MSKTTKTDAALDAANHYKTADLPDGRLAKYEKLVAKAEKVRKKQEKRWRVYERLYYNELAFTKSKSTQLQVAAPLSLNRTMMAVIGDYLPTFDAAPRNRRSMKFADMLQKRKREWERSTDFYDRVLDACSENNIYGNAVMYCGEQYKNDEFAGAEPRNEDLFSVFPAPNATGLDYTKGEADYVILQKPMELEKAKIFLKKIAKLTGQPLEWIDSLQGEGNLDEYRSFKEVKNEGGEQGNYVLFKTIYIKDADDDADEFPMGRVTVWLGSKKNRRKVYSKKVIQFPYFWFKNHGSAKRLYGKSEVSLVATLTLSLNEVLSGIAENIKKTGNPILKISKKLWNQFRTAITGKAGERVKVDRNTDLQYEPVPSLNNAAFQYIEILMRLIDMVSGIHDIMQGKKPTGVTAASAIAELSEAAQAGVRYKIKHDINPVMKKMGAHIIRMFQLHDRTVRDIRERSFGGYSFTKYDPVSRFAEDEEGEMVPTQGTEGMRLRDAELDVDVVTGVRMPVGRVALEAWARSMHKEGIMSIEWYVQYSLVDDKEAFLADYYRWKGIEGEVQAYDAEDQAKKDFGKLAKHLVGLDKKRKADTQEGAVPDIENVRNYKLTEEAMGTLLEQYPRLVKSTEFKTLDDAMQQRLTTVFWEDNQEVQAA